MCRFFKYLEIRSFWWICSANAWILCLWKAPGQMMLHAGAPWTGQVLMSAACLKKSKVKVLFWMSRKLETILLNVEHAVKWSSFEGAVKIESKALGISVVRKWWNWEFRLICIGEYSIGKHLDGQECFCPAVCFRKLGWSWRMVYCPRRAADRWCYGLRRELKEGVWSPERTEWRCMVSGEN